MLALAVWNGWRQGFVVQICSLTGIVAGIWLAARFGAQVGGWLRLDAEVAAAGGFVTVLVAVILVVAIAGRLVRKVFQVEKGGLDRRYDDLSQTLGETLLTPTRIYVKPVLALLEAGVRIRSVSHITGGGFYENIPRSLAEGMEARIERSAVRVLPIFEIIAREGGIPERDMFYTFNMGVGRCLSGAAEDVDLALDSLADAGEDGAYALGEIVRGEGGIELC